MLQAKTEYGRIVILSSFTKEEILAWKKKTQFFCPTCHEPVIVKAGSKTVPHFAHSSRSNCPSQEGGEGAYHEKGKWLLFQWLKHQQLDVQLEANLPAINQRPDVLIKLKDKTVAIEYQCARIPPEQIIQRNKGYDSQGIVPIWILGANRLDRYNRDQIKIDQFQLYFIHQFSPDFPLTLYYFCPDTLRLILFQDLYFPTKQRAAGKMLIKPLNDMIFTDLFRISFFTKKKIYQIWKGEKYIFRTKPSRRVYGRDLAWHQWVYVNGTHKESLPSFIHLPVSAQYRMVTPPWDWQSRLCLEMINPLAIGETFSLGRCIHFLRHHLRHAKFFPLIRSAANPIYQYLQLLEYLQIVRETSPHCFIKQNPIPFYQHIEAALGKDDQLMDHFMKQNEGMNVK
ncbi:Competence protein CoiA-like family, contains a predicted nuclease domain [Lentibacillus halodurans]|uniref:Competence protein CoiA-like family, contains a predicted nuclease domain n=1 Tax=Lentibacillus halodurans TaxID=237679 RepID=A0A1I0W2K1_9BACI|nr:competence protein CoiA family protein [Lentibacillus halodurans]SFA82577.1 Competence protein CoiA-like family, contains a predicted nuclease domain [Lentibacillus halodurans]